MTPKQFKAKLIAIKNIINPNKIKCRTVEDETNKKGIGLGRKSILIGKIPFTNKMIKDIANKNNIKLSVVLIKRMLIYKAKSIICPCCKIRLVKDYKYNCGRWKCILHTKKQTCLNKYGVDNYSKSKEYANKVRNTSIERYGAISYSATEECKDKVRNTNIERYGVENYTKTEIYKKKSKDTSIKKYGVDNYAKTKEYKDRVKQTCLEKYGVEHHLSSKDVKEKRKQTCLETYGVENVAQSKQIKGKVKETWSKRTKEQERNRVLKAYQTRKKNGTHSISKPELKALKLLLAFFPKTKTQYYSDSYPFNCDFYIPEIDTYIEYQGSWVHGGQPFNSKSKKHKKQLKLLKKKAKENPREKQGKKGNFYASAIEVWTKSDPLKRKIAIKNNLNWYEFFNYEDLYKFILKLRNTYIISRIEKFLIKNNIKFTKPKNRVFQLDEKTRIEYISPEQTEVNHYKLRLQREKQDKFSYIIRSYEWLDKRKRKIIKSNLLHLVCKTKNKIFARKTKVIELTNKEVKQFQLDNCFYGYRPATINLGLVYNNKLAMVTTFGANFFGKKKDIEIYRVGTKRNYHIVGGMTKLIKYYQNNYNKENKRIKYYLDCCHHNGKSLTESNGYNFITDNYGFHNYELETGIASNRNPSKHKEIQERVNLGELIVVPTAGTKSFWLS